MKIRERILHDKPESPVVETMPYRDGVTKVRPVGISNVSLNFTDTSLAEKVAGICNWAAKNLYTGKALRICEGITREVEVMQRRIEELQEMLNPLTLGPLILRTQCDLCPA